MISYTIGGKSLSIALDWVGLGFTALSKHGQRGLKCGADILKCIHTELGGSQLCKHPFYEEAYRGDGWSFFYQPKKGVKNPPFALEIRGSCFTGGLRPEVFDSLVDIFYDGGSFCNPYRIDARLDIFEKIPEKEISFFSSFMEGTYFFDENKVLTGFKVGKGEVVYRLYDKKIEQEVGGNSISKPHWWRWEVQIRGDVLKKQFPCIPGVFHYHEFLEVGVLMLSNRVKVNVNPSWIQSYAGHVISGDIVKVTKKKGTPEGSIRWFARELERRTRQFYNSLLRKYPELETVVCCKPVDGAEEWYNQNPVWEDEIGNAKEENE